MHETARLCLGGCASCGLTNSIDNYPAMAERVCRFAGHEDLLAKLQTAEAERNELQAEVADMKKQAAYGKAKIAYPRLKSEQVVAGSPEPATKSDQSKACVVQ